MADITKIQLEDGVYNIKDTIARKKISILNYEKSNKGFAHRGLSSEAPENTIASVYKAGYHGCYGVEIDVQVTSDGNIVVMHDTTVDRMTDGTGTINQLDSAYIDSLVIDAGNYVSEYPTQHIPYLSQILEICNKFNMVPMIELKGEWTDENLSQLLTIIKNYNYMKRAIIISFVIEQLIAIRNINSDIELALLYDPEVNSTILNSIKNIGNCGISLDYINNTSITDELRLFMINNNIPFGFWTIDNKGIIDTLLTNNPGTSFIVSNYGYGGELKPFTKLIVSIFKTDSVVSWQSTSPSEIAYYYDLFTVSLYNPSTKEYRLNYVTPFPNLINNYATIVTSDIGSTFKGQYSIYVRGQENSGFYFRIIENETGNAITLSDFRTATGADTFVNFTINGY